MFGEFLREASVLLLVFGVLLYGKQPLTIWWYPTIVALVVVMFAAGMVIEVRRK